MAYYFARIREIDHGGSVDDPGVEHTNVVLLKADSAEAARARAEQILLELYQHEMESERSKPDGFGQVRLDVVWTWEGGTIEGYVDTVEEVPESNAEVLRRYPTCRMGPDRRRGTCRAQEAQS